METLFGVPAQPDGVWQDKRVRFDISAKGARMCRGEALLEVLEPVEDTKGNNGELGDLQVTSLRLIWVSKTSKRTNISIGLGCISNLTTRKVTSRLKGETHSLYILTKMHTQRLEFVFTHVLKNSGQMLNHIQAVHQAYDRSRLYRDLKLRGAFIQNRELKLLPLEQAYSKVNGVWNLSSEQGNLGSFFISNVRVVWYSNLADSFNVSIPYLQMQSVKVRASKFGDALVIQTSQASGAYTLGFKVDPKETLDYVLQEISRLHDTFSKHPILGVEVDIPALGLQEAADYKASAELQHEEEDVLLADPDDRGDALALYYAETEGGSGRDPVFCPELGLAIEPLQEGCTVEQLWSVL